tara:strand:+ start:311 stop:433 length:123 start_codon:yes stop_codon:yes gene_type:complete
MVRHGQASADRNEIDFKNICGLVMKEDGKEKPPPNNQGRI